MKKINQEGREAWEERKRARRRKRNGGTKREDGEKDSEKCQTLLNYQLSIHVF